MNRTFLIFLMIGTAMMIAVIGQHETDYQQQLDYNPWDIDILEGGSSRVFGITLGKTSIQEANQIYAHFAKTLLLVNTNDDGSSNLRMQARYDELTIGGIVAEIRLDYQLDQQQLQQIYNESQDKIEAAPQPIQSLSPIELSPEIEARYLATPVSMITFLPAIDIGENLIRQRFGQPGSETRVDDSYSQWNYPTLGLTIRLYSNQPDHFIYQPLK